MKSNQNPNPWNPIKLIKIDWNELKSIQMNKSRFTLVTIKSNYQIPQQSIGISRNWSTSIKTDPKSLKK